MMCYVSNPIARTLAAAMVLSGISFIGLSPAVSFAQTAGFGSSSSTTLLVQGTDSSTEPMQTPIQENGARQPALNGIAPRINYLHERLQITPAQEPLWANVAQVMRENVNLVAPLIQERAKSATSGNAIDNLGSYEKLGEAQLDGLRKFSAAFRALYASLSDDQKKIADEVLRLGPLNMFGGIPELPEQLVAPAPYPSYPTFPLYRYYPPYPYYAPYSYYPSYSYYHYYSPWLWGPPFGLGASFFFVHRHHHHGFLPPSPVARIGPPSGRGSVVHHR